MIRILGAVMLAGGVFWVGSASAQSCQTDFDGNGVTDEADFEILRAHFGAIEGDETYSAAVDLDGDGEIGLGDLNVFNSCK